MICLPPEIVTGSCLTRTQLALPLRAAASRQTA
jgi:hypothetical protein